MNGEWYKKWVKQNAFSEFDEAGNPKILLAKNSVKFIEFDEPHHSHGRPLLMKMLDISYTLQW